jgi:hypothetical protein
LLSLEESINVEKDKMFLEKMDGWQMAFLDSWKVGFDECFMGFG